MSGLGLRATLYVTPDSTTCHLPYPGEVFFFDGYKMEQRQRRREKSRLRCHNFIAMKTNIYSSAFSSAGASTAGASSAFAAAFFDERRVRVAFLAALGLSIFSL